ncbi:hypothetical protein BU16DRAFT_523805 [Lophium mytilinum]|uniref:J domain-containing protein n=1 Tax=Lophium mytilinum TaxID=390894 RepID=A0A6A6R475_9PEZI|nr:hypothetical protein BU16DRAFT_523805 [Lophium mytilinum]
MKPHALLALVLGLLVSLAAAWEKEDHEIFRVRDEVVAHEGADVSFYDLLDITPSATQDQIIKAYRKKSRETHPDKARQVFIANYGKVPKAKAADKKKKPGVTVRKGQPSKKEIDAFVKEATPRYQRLTVIVEILKGPSRERYDHFLRNGFPKWRGTNYYYTRFRPGLGSVLLGLLVVGGGAVHYGTLILSWKRHREFVERYIRNARRTAWGDESGIGGIPGVNGTPASQGWETPSNGDEPQEGVLMNRRQKRNQEKESRKAKNGKAAKGARSSGISTPVEAVLTSGPVGAKKRVQMENGKTMIVDSVGNVYIEEKTEEGKTEEYLLDIDEIPKPTIYDTLLWRLPKFLYMQSVGRILHKKEVDDALFDSEDETEAATLTSATAPNAYAEARKRKLERAK